jgi:hypothetical protein
MKIHELKIKPEFYIEVFMEKKSFELRKNDRDFQVGDMIILKEFDDSLGFTELSIARKIIYILKDYKGLEKDYVILQIA